MPSSVNLVIFLYWVGPVPYLELFWAGPVKKIILYNHDFTEARRASALGMKVQIAMQLLTEEKNRKGRRVVLVAKKI